MVRRNMLTLAALAISSASLSQPEEPFFVEVEEFSIPNMPGLQSFAWGKWENKWVVIGGRKDGLHQRQPFASFLASDNNTRIYVVDPAAGTVDSADLSVAPTAVFEQLQCTNMEFAQRDSVLYIAGGYGFSPTANDHITHDKLSAVTLPVLIDHIMTGQSIGSDFRQLSDTAVRVTGGYFGIRLDTFYLVGGQNFKGRYNPMGPSHGPGFEQHYANRIRKFTVQDDGTTLTLSNYWEVEDTLHLHRRDYNLSKVIYPDGQIGFVAFSGVFQHAVDLPWLDIVDIYDTGYVVRTDFNQMLNQYHTANMSLQDSANRAFHNVFFGGMSRYTIDQNGLFVDDPNVPFVNTISQVTRHANNTLSELQVGAMPGLLGSGSEFIPENDAYFSDDILVVDRLPYSKTLVGYLVGGIESTAANIFFVNDGTQSDATTRLFKVYVTRGISSNKTILLNGDNYFKFEVLQENNRDIILQFGTANPTHGNISLFDTNGREIHLLYDGALQGENRITVSGHRLATGVYHIVISDNVYRKSETIVVK